MNPAFLERWQADALAQALWATHQPGARNWQRLEPNRPQTTPGQQIPVEDKYTGRYYLRQVQGTPRPKYLPVRVPELLPWSIPEHNLVITWHDYQRYIFDLARTNEKEFKAWNDYVIKARLSSIFWLEFDRSRTYWSVQRSGYASKQLADVALDLLQVAEKPSIEALTLADVI